jgi:hypothetical protein
MSLSCVTSQQQVYIHSKLVSKAIRHIKQKEHILKDSYILTIDWSESPITRTNSFPASAASKKKKENT